MASSGSGLLPENGVWGHAPPSAFGRAAASPQTRQMRCWLSAAQAAYHSFPSLPPTKTRSLRCTAFFPPKPLRWVSAGVLLGGDKNSRFAFLRRSCMGVVSLPSVRDSCRRNAGRPRVTAAYLPFLCRLGICPVRAEHLPSAGTFPCAVLRAHTAAHTGKHGAFSPPETSTGSIGSTA